MSDTAAAPTVDHRRTYWCHECDMSVPLSLSSSSSPALLCPQCHSDFLEEMDSPTPFHSDNSLLDTPFLHHLIRHLTDSNQPNDGPDLLPPRYLNPNFIPASRASVDALPTFKISPSFLELDPISFCAVCKDQFVLDVEAKRLPCNHIYHSDCILPWLSHQNSCPLCRFRLPTDEGEDEGGGDVGSTLTFTFGDLMEDGELFGLGSTLRHIARRNRLVFPALSAGAHSEAEAAILGSDNTAATLPGWPRQGLVGGGGGGDAYYLAGALNNEDADSVAPEVRVLGSS